MAAAHYLDQVQELYIAYFGRPADPAGLTYWAQQIDGAGGNLSVAISGFSASAEAKALYGDVSPEQQVVAIYQNLFGRAPEPAGLAYWADVIASGGSASEMAFRVLQAARGSDAAVIGNKLIAANAFTAQIDTAAEISGYKGADALAAARNFLSKVDSSPASIANLESDAATAVGKATGTGSGGDAGAGGGGSPPPFTAVKDAGTDEVTLAHGTHIAVTLSGGTYIFTSGGTSVDIAGPVTGIRIPAGATLSTDLATADTISFPDAGTLVLTDTAASASQLKAIEAATAGLLDATTVATLTGSTSAADAQLLLVTNNGSSGDKIRTAANVSVSLGDTTADAAILKAIETHTTGLVDATGVAGITNASAADAKQLLVTDRGSAGDKIDLAADVTVTLTDTSATATDLKTIEAATTGLVSFGNPSGIINGTLAEVQALYSHSGSAGDKIFIPGSVGIALNDAGTVSASGLKAIDVLTTGKVIAAKLDYHGDVISGTGPTGISGNIADVQAVLEANTSYGTAAQLWLPSLDSVKITDSITDAAAFDHVTFANDTTLRLFSQGSNSLTLSGASVATGKTLTVDASTTNGLNLDARAITDSSVSLSVKTDGGSGAATSIWGGSGADSFYITQQSTGNVIHYDASNMSTLAHMDTVKNYQQSGGAVFDFALAGGIAQNSTVVDESDKASLQDALNDVANNQNGATNELYVFTQAGNTYLYIESNGAATSYADGDFVLKILGTPFALDASVSSLSLFSSV